MYCRFCGANIKDNSIFCGKCGNNLSDVSKQNPDSPVMQKSVLNVVSAYGSKIGLIIAVTISPFMVFLRMIFQKYAGNIRREGELVRRDVYALPESLQVTFFFFLILFLAGSQYFMLSASNRTRASMTRNIIFSAISFIIGMIFIFVTFYD